MLNSNALFHVITAAITQFSPAPDSKLDDPTAWSKAPIQSASHSESTQSHVSEDDDTQNSEPNLEARGVLRASRTADLAAPMSARIEQSPYKAGQYVKRGSVLIRFDCSAMQAEAKALDLAHSAFNLEYETQSELLAAGAAGGLDVDLAKAKTQRAKAEWTAITARLKDCIVYAPFSGYVTQTFVNRYETPGQGAPMLSLNAAAAPEISIIMPSRWLRWVKTGTEFDFYVDETGTHHSAKVIRKGAQVDAVSQTVEITGRFNGQTPGILAGMSGMAKFKAPPNANTESLDQ